MHATYVKLFVQMLKKKATSNNVQITLIQLPQFALAYGNIVYPVAETNKVKRKCIYVYFLHCCVSVLGGRPMCCSERDC